jgi:hypothetical protein
LLGGKIYLTFGVLITAILTLLTPIVASSKASETGVIIVRVLEGLGEAVTCKILLAFAMRRIFYINKRCIRSGNACNVFCLGSNQRKNNFTNHCL